MEWLLSTLAIVMLTNGLTFYFFKRREKHIKQVTSASVERKVLEAVKEQSAQIYQSQSKLDALQSQINPHFLYNTLDSIRGHALTESQTEIAEMVEALSSFFRYSISRKGNLVTLSDELKNMDNYVLIQNYRFNNRYHFQVEVEDRKEVLDYFVPKLTIQPIIENAIFHGLEALGTGMVLVKVETLQDRLLVTISDNGVGMSQEALLSVNEKLEKDMIIENTGKSAGTGIALINVNKRIKLLFGNEFGLNVYSTLGKGTDVEVVMPLVKVRSEAYEN